RTEICITRYGNVLASRGSVVPLFVNQMREGKELTITDPNMTRFIMTLEEAVDLVVFALENGKSGDIMVQKAPASTIDDLMEATKQLFDASAKSNVIGIRHGEKMYETLLTNEESANAVDMGNFYRVPADTRDLNYEKYFIDGDEERSVLSEFNSDNTELLNVEEIKEKLFTVPYVQEEVAKWKADK